MHLRIMTSVIICVSDARTQGREEDNRFYSTGSPFTLSKGPTCYDPQ